MESKDRCPGKAYVSLPDALERVSAIPNMLKHTTDVCNEVQQCTSANRQG